MTSSALSPRFAATEELGSGAHAPRYGLAEEIASSVIHGLGILLSIADLFITVK